MNQISALFRKELMESIRNFKLIAVFIVFIILGVLSPFIALIMPELLGSLMADSGVNMDIPESTAVDAYTQFFSNMNQMGLVIFTIVFGSILTHELAGNTLINLITKGLKRTHIIVVKSIFIMVVWTVSFAASALVTHLYTMYYWDETVESLILSLAMTWLFGLFIISLIMLASTIFTGSVVGVLVSIVSIVILMMIFGIHPDIAEYLPQYLISSNVPLLTGEVEASEVWWPVGITIGITVLFFMLSILRFKRMTMQ